MKFWAWILTRCFKRRRSAKKNWALKGCFTRKLFLLLRFPCSARGFCNFPLSLLSLLILYNMKRLKPGWTRLNWTSLTLVSFDLSAVVTIDHAATLTSAIWDFVCELQANAKVKNNKIKLYEKWQSPRAFEGEKWQKQNSLKVKFPFICHTFESESNVTFELEQLCVWGHRGSVFFCR